MCCSGNNTYFMMSYNWKQMITRMHSSNMRTARMLPRGVSLDRDPPGQRLPTGQRSSGQRPLWTETCLDRDLPRKETPLRTETHLDRDSQLDRDPWTETPWTETPWTETSLDRDPPEQRPPWTENPLDRDLPGKRTPGQRAPGHRPPWT